VADNFESVLDESISAMQAGVPIDEILAEVPDYADELRPLLFAAAILTDPNPALVPEERKAALRAEYLKQASELPAPPAWADKTRAFLRVIRKRLTPKAILSDLITVAITAALTLLMAALILTYLAVDTIPGDFLYGVKRMSENVQLALTFNAADRAELADSFNQRRLAEIERLIEQNRAALVRFRGILETKGENVWIVEGHTVFLPTDLQMQDDIREGDTVEVVGLLRTSNVLVADSIRRVQ
jgi:hypothetical protein